MTDGQMPLPACSRCRWRSVNRSAAATATATARLFLPSVHCGTVTGAKMADNREEISELVEKRGICRRVASHTHRNYVVPWTPRYRAVRRASQDGQPSPRHVLSSVHARPRHRRTSSVSRGPRRVPRTIRWTIARARRSSSISTGCSAVRDVIRVTRDSTVTAVIVAVTFVFLAARLSDVIRSVRVWQRV